LQNFAAWQALTVRSKSGGIIKKVTLLAWFHQFCHSLRRTNIRLPEPSTFHLHANWGKDRLRCHRRRPNGPIKLAQGG
jgi:hypothetical protein